MPRNQSSINKTLQDSASILAYMADTALALCNHTAMAAKGAPDLPILELFIKERFHNRQLLPI